MRGLQTLQPLPSVDILLCRRKRAAWHSSSMAHHLSTPLGTRASVWGCKTSPPSCSSADTLGGCYTGGGGRIRCAGLRQGVCSWGTYTPATLDAAGTGLTWCQSTATDMGEQRLDWAKKFGPAGLQGCC
jgi:hypothetical protein